MASVLILEQGGNSDRDADSIVELRGKLGLPQPETIDPTGRPMNGLPLVRVGRLKLDAVSDEDLSILYRRAVLIGAQAALARLAREAVRRPSVARLIPPADAYQRLISSERNPQEALALIGEARERAKTDGVSPATWDLAELELRITSGQVEEAKDLLQRIERDYGDDPQVGAALYQLLYETGVIPAEMPAQAQGRPHRHEPPAMASTAAAEPPGKIWTPDSDRPAGGKSALWTPS
jgi:hypothetical protein